MSVAHRGLMEWVHLLPRNLWSLKEQVRKMSVAHLDLMEWIH